MPNTLDPMAKMHSKEPTKFARLLPSTAIKTYQGIIYKDINDVSDQERKETKSFFAHDPSYIAAIKFGSHLYRGKEVGKQFCAYTYIQDKPIGSIKFTEFLDNPHGYGQGDLLYHKWIYPEYRYTKYSRYIIGGLTHMMFMSNVCNRFYVYVPIDKQADFWMDRVNKELTPCISKQYNSDNADTQKYIIPKQVLPSFKMDYLLLEFNGDIYRSMDIEKYLLAAPNRSKEIIDRWLSEMNEAARLVKETYYASLDD